MAEQKKKRLSEIGARIRDRREELGFTQAEMADCLEIRVESYNYVENGKRDLKTAELAQISEKLNTSTDYLLKGVSPENFGLVQALGLSDKAATVMREATPGFLYFINRFLESPDLYDFAENVLSYQSGTACILGFKDKASPKELDIVFGDSANARMMAATEILKKVFSATDKDDFFAAGSPFNLPAKELKQEIIEMVKGLDKKQAKQLFKRLAILLNLFKESDDNNEEAPE